MKTAISVPDSIFEAAEELADRLSVSRSELYTKAVSAYIEKYRNDNVTENLNKIYDKEKSSLDPIIQDLQFHSLLKEDW